MHLSRILLALLLSLLILPFGGAVKSSVAASQRQAISAKCQPITVDQCRDLPYNITRFPNLVGDETQREAESAFGTFDPLIAIHCSSQLKFFLCSIYFPMCTDKLPIAIGPCRPLCENVRNRCEPLLKDFGFPWPVSMNCSKFPAENNDDDMCMMGPVGDSEEFAPPRPPLESQPDHRPDSQGKCPTTNTVYVNRTGQCVPLCQSLHGFSREERDAASAALFALSLISCLLSAVCLLVFCVKRKTLDCFPERALVFCSISFGFTALVYLFSLIYRDQISCMPYTSNSVLIVPGLSHVPCTLTGILIYYFGFSGRLWWCIMAYTWNRFTAPIAFTIHMLAWATPLAAVITALVAQAIHADGLSGACLVGGGHRIHETVFVAVREFVLLMITTAALVSGFCSRVGTVPPSDNDHPVLINGILACVYPLSAILLLVYSFQSWMSVSTSFSWNFITAFRTLVDPTLGIFSSLACLLAMLISLYHCNRSPSSGKGVVYLPGRPLMPQSLPPPPPPSAHFTYSMQRHRQSPAAIF